MAVFSSRRLRWFGEMGGQSRGAGAGSGGDGSGGSFLNGGVAFFRWVGGAGVGRSRLEGGGEVILLPALGLALRLELPQALSLESLREMGGRDGTFWGVTEVKANIPILWQTILGKAAGEIETKWDDEWDDGK